MATGTIPYHRTKTEFILNLASNLPTTARSYTCPWQNYSLLIVCATFYGNVQTTAIVTKEYFSSTHSGERILLTNTFSSANGLYYEIYQNGNGYVYLKASAAATNYGLRIYGIV